MSQKTFDVVAGIMFLLVAAGHLLRLLFGWSAVIAGASVPMWVSVAAIVVSGYLAYSGLRASRSSS